MARQDERGEAAWKRVVGWIAGAALIGAAGLVGSARWFWAGELAASGAVQLGWAAAILGLGLGWLGRWRVALLALALALWWAAPESTLGLRRWERSKATPDLRLASANLLCTNSEVPEVRDLLLGLEPDVLHLMEFRGALANALDEALAATHPHRFTVDDPFDAPPGAWGSAVYSRHPFQSVREVQAPIDDGTVRPAIEVELRIDDRTVVLQLAHPSPAGRAWRLEKRDAQLLDLSRRVPGEGALRILAGDLNVAPTSPVFRRVLRAGALRDSRRGFGRQPTWRTAELLPTPSIRSALRDLRASWIPIDHVLVGPGIEVVDRWTVLLPGSDHLAVVADLAW